MWGGGGRDVCVKEFGKQISLCIREHACTRVVLRGLMGMPQSSFRSTPLHSIRRYGHLTNKQPSKVSGILKSQLRLMPRRLDIHILQLRINLINLAINGLDISSGSHLNSFPLRDIATIWWTCWCCSGAARPRCFINNSSAFSLSAHHTGTPDCCDNGTRKPRAGGSGRRMLGGDEAVGRDVMS